MEKLKNTYEIFVKVSNTFKEVIDLFVETKNIATPIQYKLNVGGIIQHFEMAYEACWKFLKKYLEEKHAIVENSPRSVLQACYKFQVLPADLVETLLSFINDRNQTVHVYDQETAEELCKEITHYHNTFEKVKSYIKMH